MRMVVQIGSAMWCIARILVIITLIPVFSIPAFLGIAIAIPILVVYRPIWGIRQIGKHWKNGLKVTESRSRTTPSPP